MKRICILAVFWVLVFSPWTPPFAWAYPIDGYPETGIRRLAYLSMVNQGALKGPQLPLGARKPSGEILLNLKDAAGSPPLIPGVTPDLQHDIDALFPDRDESYALCLLEISNKKPWRYAQRQPDRLASPGSVGKLAIAAGLFAALARRYPDSIEQRIAFLKTQEITADHFIHTDHHDIPLFDMDRLTIVEREVREGDRFTFYEWLDHMLSASANAAASLVWKELMLLHHFGAAYPPTLEAAQAFFSETSGAVLRDMAMAVVNDPLRSAGIAKAEWQLGSFFTANGKKIVPGGGSSYASCRGLMKFLVALESGRVVDPWSSLEIKKLMYMTSRRIRYASSPALNKAAVYYKSGSLYHCKPEPDFNCVKYRGNVDNYMNSVAIVEHPDGRVYLVALMSNVLKKNSAVEHQSLATFIDRILARPILPETP